MKVLVYLYYPLYDEHLAGGVQVWIKNLIRYIEKQNRGIKFQIVCPNGKADCFPDDISIDHSLVDMERDFVSPKDIYNNLNKIKQYEKQADVIWMVDRSFPVESKKPKLLSLNTICYEREIMSLFQSGWDELVVLTNYVKKQVDKYISNKLSVIPCYVDHIFLNKKNNPELMKKYFNYDSNNKYILFPHRPDLSKGHITAIDILKKLVLNDNRYRLLIPMPPHAKESNISREKEIIEEVKKYVELQKLEKYVIFHDWIDYSDLPIYYSVGEVTLFLSQLPETFGITLLNSISVGTPVISYGTGALNEVVPVGNGHFNISDVEDAVKIILKGFNEFDIKNDMEYVKEKYNIKTIAENYIKLFEKVQEAKENE